MAEQQDKAPFWSVDLNSDYTLGSKIIKSGDFGSQAVYHYEIEALRTSIYSTNTICNLEWIRNDTISRVRTPLSVLNLQRRRRSLFLLLDWRRLSLRFSSLNPVFTTPELYHR